MQIIMSTDMKKSFIGFVKKVVTDSGYSVRVSSTLGNPIPKEGQIQITQLGGSGRKTLVTSNTSFIVSVWDLSESKASEVARLIEAVFYATEEIDGVPIYNHSTYGSPVLTHAPDSNDFKKVSFTVSFNHSLEVKDL